MAKYYYVCTSCRSASYMFNSAVLQWSDSKDYTGKMKSWCLETTQLWRWDRKLLKTYDMPTIDVLHMVCSVEKHIVHSFLGNPLVSSHFLVYFVGSNFPQWSQRERMAGRWRTTSGSWTFGNKTRGSVAGSM